MKKSQLSLKKWEIEYPDLEQLKIRSKKKNLTEKEYSACIDKINDLINGHFASFIRKRHGKRSAEYINKTYNQDPRLIFENVNISRIIEKICQSHTQNVSILTESNGFRYNERVGEYKINMVYLALILRLADILDFTQARTPEIIFKTINFSSKISLIEWKKHLSVLGHEITTNKIQFSCMCEKPEYEKAIRELMDWIDQEIQLAIDITKKFPQEYSQYYFELPILVDRSQICPRENTYIYVDDLNFSLSRDEIVKLFMTKNLYQDPTLCIRELLQNSLDAHRHRQAYFKTRQELSWDGGCIKFKHYLNEDGYEVLCCKDQGIGMNLEIIKKYLLSVGKSYYNSLEFKNERETFKEKGVDFDPFAQFGIGFLSCFMIGDQIKIWTRRFKGPDITPDQPYIVEINGLGGLITIRKGELDQEIGTNVEIIRRDKELFYPPPRMGKIRLINTLLNYAIDCEFPIIADCKIPFLEKQITISSGMQQFQSQMKESGLTRLKSVILDINGIVENLNGYMRIDFLIDKTGNIVLSNEEAKWEYNLKNNSYDLIKLDSNNKIDRMNFSNQILCLDGIKISGFSKSSWYFGFPLIPNPFDLGLVEYIFNISGNLKAPLTPERRPPFRPSKIHKAWFKIIDRAHYVCGCLWEKVLNLISNNDSELFFKLLKVYKGDILWLKAELIWEKIQLPFKQYDVIKWEKISEIKEIYFTFNKKTVALTNDKGGVFTLTPFFNDFTPNNTYYMLIELLILMSTVQFDKEPLFTLTKPYKPEKGLFENIFHIDFHRFYFIPFAQEHNDIILFRLGNDEHSWNIANSRNNLSKIVFENRFSEKLTEIGLFANRALEIFGDPITITLLGSEEYNPTYFMKYLGNLYLHVKDELNADLRPPYKIWCDKAGIVEITHEILENWAKAERLCH
ncbi:MAG: HD domain-containing protein [Candidatus Helarchaeota archaeon]